MTRKVSFPLVQMIGFIMSREQENYEDYVLRRFREERLQRGLIHESPDGGKTVKTRVMRDHPIHLLVNGKIPPDIWYKVFGNDR